MNHNKIRKTFYKVDDKLSDSDLTFKCEETPICTKKNGRNSQNTTTILFRVDFSSQYTTVKLKEKKNKKKRKKKIGRDIVSHWVVVFQD
ncbi:Beta-glucosidase 12 [Frankliniella fusca]|uniref:Beta-glucosidase 12 n=1 Tax=Frankliniella fusca TaxID=407009 RepID=A0AAE1LU19_9NEOP|nr:Beta-glucosidase 12 [Frankliniella fusca]